MGRKQSNHVMYTSYSNHIKILAVRRFIIFRANTVDILNVPHNHLRANIYKSNVAHAGMNLYVAILIKN